MGYSSRIDSEKALKSATDNILEYGKSDLSRFYVNSLGKIYGKTLGAGWSGYKDFVSKVEYGTCLLYTSPSPRDRTRSRMPSSA